MKSSYIEEFIWRNNNTYTHVQAADKIIDIREFSKVYPAVDPFVRINEHQLPVRADQTSINVQDGNSVPKDYTPTAYGRVRARINLPDIYTPENDLIEKFDE